MKLLVAGGAGYIGSHTVVELLNHDHEIVIVDDLSNSSEDIIEKIETITNKKVLFYKLDVSKKELVEPLFKKHHFDGIIHFAGYKAVGESVEKPLSYYHNNLLCTITLAELAATYKVNRFVFSSSATVYGNQQSPFKEDMELLETTNPYGETKAMGERILMDWSKANPNVGISLLRYFNPVGAHPSGIIGEKPQGVPNNLMPYMTQTAKGIFDKLFVYGSDYPTKDGSGVREYIHVVDLAQGHVLAIEKSTPGTHVYNLGQGKGISVLELIHIFEQENQVEIPYEITERRAGDIAISYA
ncbi:MAG: UDP-glucose 4-epimerase GalE, partial [Erysipelothrix sp.]|nr:UDP-glucose 4-epimerase GalE [Erysipelothrix sp.]